MPPRPLPPPPPDLESWRSRRARPAREVARPKFRPWASRWESPGGDRRNSRRRESRGAPERAQERAQEAGIETLASVTQTEAEERNERRGGDGNGNDGRATGMVITGNQRAPGRRPRGLLRGAAGTSRRKPGGPRSRATTMLPLRGTGTGKMSVELAAATGTKRGGAGVGSRAGGSIDGVSGTTASGGNDSATTWGSLGGFARPQRRGERTRFQCAHVDNAGAQTRGDCRRRWRSLRELPDHRCLERRGVSIVVVSHRRRRR